MTPISTRHVFLAGLASGVVLNIGGMTSAALLGLGEAFERFGIVPGGVGVLLHVTLRFCVGLAAAYVYAGMTPRLGFGTRNVVRVAAAIWFIGYAPPLALLSEIGFLTQTQAILSAAWGLAEAFAAVALAAMIYKAASSDGSA